MPKSEDKSFIRKNSCCLSKTSNGPRFSMPRPMLMRMLLFGQNNEASALRYRSGSRLHHKGVREVLTIRRVAPTAPVPTTPHNTTQTNHALVFSSARERYLSFPSENPVFPSRSRQIRVGYKKQVGILRSPLKRQVTSTGDHLVVGTEIKSIERLSQNLAWHYINGSLSSFCSTLVFIYGPTHNCSPHPQVSQ